MNVKCPYCQNMNNVETGKKVCCRVCDCTFQLAEDSTEVLPIFEVKF